MSMFLYQKQFFSSFTFTFQDLIKFNQFGNAVQCRIFVLYTHAPLSVPSTMHIVISINSICSRFIRSDSFIPWNQKDPAALSLLTHSVSLVDFITTINLIETIYSIISMPSVQPSNQYFTFYSNLIDAFQ